MFYIHFLKHLDYGHVTPKRIVQTFRSSLNEPATLIMLSHEQPPDIGGNAGSINSPVTFLPKRLSKTELFLAGCIHKDILSKLVFV